MRHINLSLASAFALGAFGSVAMAQTETVNFDLNISQPSLFDSSRQDTFSGVIDDRSATTTLGVTCSAGASAWLGLSRVDEACAVAGSGTIKNPNNPAQSLPRLSYAGGFTIDASSDGYTDASTILANYLRAGAAGAENASFRGNLVMQPENPSESARQLGASLVNRLRETTAGSSAVQFNTDIDSVRFEGFIIPHVGQQTSESCGWTGDAIFAYANNAWQMQFDVKCGDQTYRLEGNMPLLEAPDGSAHDEEYAINLVLPGEGGGDPFAAADPFATVDGVVGTLYMTNSGRSNADGVYENVTVSGELVGTGVPLELVRGFGQIMVIFGRTYFGE